jgi:hypothetical protein
MIKRWIERIPEAIKEISALQGGNEYIESTHWQRHFRIMADAHTQRMAGEGMGNETNVNSNMETDNETASNANDLDTNEDVLESDDDLSLLHDSEEEADEEETDEVGDDFAEDNIEN